LIGISSYAEQPRHAACVWRRDPVGIDPVVNDLEALVVEALDVLEVVGEPT
jgi:hypothetical protein